jgi:hypothetical protein
LRDVRLLYPGAYAGHLQSFQFTEEEHMTICRAKVIRPVAFVFLVLVATGWAQTRPPSAEKLAKAYGLDSFSKIEAIRYTFTVSFPGFSASRTWIWEPKTGQVSYEGKDKDGKPAKVSYRRAELSSQPPAVKEEIDPGFINDQYWLVFPFHVVWDKSATVTDRGKQKLPVGNGSGDLLSVKYPSDAGYTPGDTWDLYIGSDNRVAQMVYHRGGPKKPSLVIASWGGYKKAGPLLISTDHRGTADGKPLRISFSDVAVKLSGSDAWVNAK